MSDTLQFYLDEHDFDPLTETCRICGVTAQYIENLVNDPDGPNAMPWCGIEEDADIALEERIYWENKVDLPNEDRW